MCLEPGVLPKERSIKLPRNLALVPALDQDDLLPKLGPAHHGPPCKRVSRREHGHQPVAKERHACDARPQGLARREDDVQVSLLDFCHKVPVAQFRHSQDDVRVPCPPSGQQGEERCADRRQANAEADLSHVSCAAYATGALQSLQFAEHAPHMLHHGPSTGCQANSGMPTLEQRQPEFVVEPSNTAADRRGADARGLGRPGEVAGRR